MLDHLPPELYWGMLLSSQDMRSPRSASYAGKLHLLALALADLCVFYSPKSVFDLEYRRSERSLSVAAYDTLRICG